MLCFVENPPISLLIYNLYIYIKFNDLKVISISLVKHCFSSPFVFLFYPSAFLQMAQSRNFLTDLRFGNSLEYFIIINVQTEDCWNIIFSVFDGNVLIFKIELCRSGNSMFRIENSVFCSTKSNEVHIQTKIKKSKDLVKTIIIV